ncbi:hypothetical protein ILUMI_13073 [Ignelater luminosus]|uniref:Scavenger receptor class B member 1 n=1 Tax=Ignelater luminosus TaxID=2038154 RepID=A0A8K0G663_IGNLU|nr:hypothetical protein ILUMI_13073 [Ignelater luminosus]
MELKYSKHSRLLFLAMLGGTFASLACLIFIYNPLGAIIVKALSFYPDSTAFNLWKHPPYEVLVNLYIFNVSNPKEFLRGEETLRFNEIGPYVYREELININATFNKNGSLTFVPRRLLHFMPEYSVGDPDVDTVVSPNIPLLGITASLQESSMFVNLAVASASSYLGSEAFLNLTINEYLYGYDDTLVTLANNIVPNWIDFPRFGLLDRLMALDNSSDVVTININSDDASTGSDSFAIEKWNGSPGLSQWGYEIPKENETIQKNTDCNTLEGAFMGTIFPRNIPKNSTFRLYRRAFCRTIPIVHDGNRLSKDGFEGYVYKPKKNFLASKEVNPNNDCFCKNDECLPDGLGDMSPCYYGIPIVMSRPHFLDGDPNLVKQVDGLFPDKNKHGFFMLIHPEMGVPLELKLRLQVNLRMPNTQYNAKTRPFNNLVLPLFWVELSVDTLPAEFKLYINLLYHILPVVQQVLMYGFAVISIALIFGSAVATVRHLLNSRHKTHFGLNVDYSEIPVFPLKTKVLSPQILIDK